jgi:cystathionine beta-synthase
MEQFNPGGSVKDRTALGIIEYEERTGRLTPGMTIIESSSGNTAIGLSILAKARGYRVIAVCDRHLPAVKRARLRAFGADTVFLPDTPVGLDTVQLRIRLAEHLAAELPGAITLNQYSNPGNPAIHYRMTGPEIWTALEGNVSAVVAAVGTCGTISGVGRYLKEQNPDLLIAGAEPKGSVIFGGEPGPYLVQGGGLSFVPPNFHTSSVDVGFQIPDRETFSWVRDTADQEGWMLGGTGGLVMAGIHRVVSEFGSGDTIVGIIPDAGDRYAETLFDEGWIARHAGPRRTERVPSHDPLTMLANDLGCSVNRIPTQPRPSLHDFCAALGMNAAGTVQR